MKIPEREKLEHLIRDIAREELLPEFGHAEYSFKDDGSIITPADLSMQARLQQVLFENWPEYSMLGEEMTQDEQRAVIASGQGYWCVDPLDGTSNFAAGLPFFAVSVALILNATQYLGVIYDPVRDEMFSAEKGQGAFLNGQPIKPKTFVDKDKLTIAEIDLKRLPEAMRQKLVVSNLYTSQRNVGSSAIDWCWLSAGRFDIYLHGGQKLWDYAAGSLIFSEAGGHATSLDHRPVFQGKLEARSVLASYDKSLYEKWDKWIVNELEQDI